jgi:hypothetical protein
MFQIVVQIFPDANGGKWVVTANGGMEPRWRRDGREIYYLSLDGKLMAVPVRTDAEEHAAIPVAILEADGIARCPSRPDIGTHGRNGLAIVPARYNPQRRCAEGCPESICD